MDEGLRGSGLRDASACNFRIRRSRHKGRALWRSSATIKYSAKDIRFTRSADGKTIYVFLLGQPNAGDRISLKHLADGAESDFGIEDVELLGSDDDCDWSYEDGALNLVAPAATDANVITTVFKVILK